MLEIFPEAAIIAGDNLGMSKSELNSVAYFEQARNLNFLKVGKTFRFTVNYFFMYISFYFLYSILFS